MHKDNKTLKFITIEGVDGAGKSTYIPSIKNYLESMGEEVVLTREPGGTDLGETLRGMILKHPMCTMSETLLLFAARAQHIESVIKPALDAGKWVICDRFTDSTMAYQSVGKNFPESKVRTLEHLVQEEYKPSLTFIFTVPVEISRARLLKTGKIPDKFESENEDFFAAVDNAYKNIFKKEPHRCKVVDSSKNIEETHLQVISHLEEFYQKIKNQQKPSIKM